jgi:hypothetical protein
MWLWKGACEYAEPAVICDQRLRPDLVPLPVGKPRRGSVRIAKDQTISSRFPNPYCDSTHRAILIADPC